MTADSIMEIISRGYRTRTQTNSESICNYSSRKCKVKRAHPREGTHAREVQVHRAALREVD